MMDVRFHDALQQWFLYLPAGVDARDGAPLTAAIPLRREEVRWWWQGRRRKVLLGLRARGVPVRVPQDVRGSRSVGRGA